MPFLTQDIKSSFNPADVYGNRGDEVTIVSDDHDEVLIVSNKAGRLFPVLAINVTEILQLQFLE